MQIAQIEILNHGATLRLKWQNGSCSRFHAFWLRDNAQEPDTRHPDNHQRLVSVLDVSLQSRIIQARLNASGDVCIQFDGSWVERTYPANWLAEHDYDLSASDVPSKPDSYHDTDSLNAVHKVTDHATIASDPLALRDWLSNFSNSGVARLCNVPLEPGNVCQVAELFGFVRETNYGRYFDVRNETNPSNLAYTGIGLQSHTDNPYRDPVPTIQLLHCLENSTNGGESILVDGFHAARQLQEESPQAFDLLSSHDVRFSFEGDENTYLTAQRPMIELNSLGAIRAIRFNNRSIAPIENISFELMPDYYKAYQHFARIITDPANETSFKLEAGELLAVDNTRILHSRTPFSSTGSRWLQGCYTDLDGLRSTLAVLSKRYHET